MDEISFASGSLGRVPVLERVLSKGLRSVEPASLLGYERPLGMDELRERIAGLYTGIEAQNVMVTSSAQQALGMVLTQLGERSEVLLQEPAYFGILRLLKGNSAVVPFSEFSDLENRVAEGGLVYLTSNFHNPTGVSLTPQQKQRLGLQAEATESVVLEDNPHDLLYFGDERPENVFEFAPHNTIYVGGFSKILGPGIRIGYVVADEETIGHLKSVKIDYDIFTSTLGQQVCVSALREPEYLDELRNYSRKKRDLAVSSLEETFGETEGFQWNCPEGGIFILAQARGVSMDELSESAKRYGLRLEKDKYTYADGKSRNTTRINFLQNPDADLREGIRRLYRAFQEVRR